MFEFSLAFKYLIPKKRQLSVTLISVMSVMVISVIVWLFVVFLSVTEGLERNWLSKLTSLNAPIRINPSEAYFSSYFYNIDSYCLDSNFQRKTIGEKLVSLTSDPFNAEQDMNVLHLLPTPDKTQDGQLKDPIKTCFRSLENFKKSYPGLSFQEYEIGGASLRLELIRKGRNIEPVHSYLNQVAYVATYGNNTPFHPALLMKPTSEDVQHLFEVAKNLTKPDELFSLKNLTHAIQLKKVRSQAYDWAIDTALLKSPFKADVVAFYDAEGNLKQVVLTENKEQQEKLLHYSYAKPGILKKEKEGFELTRDGVKEKYSATSLLVAFPLDHEVVKESYDAAQKTLFLDIKTPLLNQTITSRIPFSKESVVDFELTYHPSSPFVYSASHHDRPLPKSSHLGYGVIIPKTFYDKGARLGDQGYLSYGALSASSLQEQRVPIFIAGFYDPGIISIGSSCLLASEELTHLLAAQTSSYAIEKSQANGIQVWLPNLDETKAFAKQLKESFERAGIGSYFTITPFYEFDFAKDILEQFSSDKILFTLVGILILIVASCNIISLLNLLVNDKKREIAILQAMGAKKSSILLIFSFCGLILGVMSSWIGLTLAYLTLKNLSAIVSCLSWIQGSNPFNALFYGSSLPTEISTAAVIKVLIATPIIALLAGFIPALKAAHVSPSNTLRSE